jgi:hypothetical protein
MTNPTTHTDTGQLRLLQTVWEEAVAATNEALTEYDEGPPMTPEDHVRRMRAEYNERLAGRLYLAALHHHEAPSMGGSEQAWATALDDIGAVLDRYAGGPSPLYAMTALLAIKAIVEEVLP